MVDQPRTENGEKQIQTNNKEIFLRSVFLLLLDGIDYQWNQQQFGPLHHLYSMGHQPEQNIFWVTHPWPAKCTLMLLFLGCTSSLCALSLVPRPWINFYLNKNFFDRMILVQPTEQRLLQSSLLVRCCCADVVERLKKSKNEKFTFEKKKKNAKEYGFFLT